MSSGPSWSGVMPPVFIVQQLLQLKFSIDSSEQKRKELRLQPLRGRV